MSKNFFGTDGIRGTVGEDPMTADFAIRLASAAAQVLVVWVSGSVGNGGAGDGNASYGEEPARRRVEELSED